MARAPLRRLSGATCTGGPAWPAPALNHVKCDTAYLLDTGDKRHKTVKSLQLLSQCSTPTAPRAMRSLCSASSVYLNHSPGVQVFSPSCLLLISYSVGHSIHIFFFFFCFLGLHSQHMDVARLGLESELQLPAFATATATWDPSCICSLHHSSQQCWIPNPLNEARD